MPSSRQLCFLSSPFPAADCLLYLQVCHTHSLWDPQWCAWLKASVWAALEHESRHAAGSVCPSGREGKHTAYLAPTPTSSGLKPTSPPGHSRPETCSTSQPGSSPSFCWSAAGELSSWLPGILHQLSQACSHAPAPTSLQLSQACTQGPATTLLPANAMVSRVRYSTQ